MEICTHKTDTKHARAHTPTHFSVRKGWITSQFTRISHALPPGSGFTARARRTPDSFRCSFATGEPNATTQERVCEAMHVIPISTKDQKTCTELKRESLALNLQCERTARNMAKTERLVTLIVARASVYALVRGWKKKKSSSESGINHVSGSHLVSPEFTSPGHR